MTTAGEPAPPPPQDAEDGGDETAEEVARRTGVRGLLDLGKDRYGAGRAWATALLDRHRERPPVDLALRFIERDREAAGAVVGSAIAFRLFMFFVPLVLFVVGVAGFFANIVTSKEIDDAGITGTLAAQINTALTQPSSTRWIAVGAGFIGMITTGRTLSKALAGASCLAWRIPVRSKASVRVIGGVIGLLVGLGLVAGILNRIRESFGVAGASVSFVAVLAVYTVGALVLATLLPRGTTDPGALLPGAAVVGVTLAGLHAVSQFYLPDRFDRASELYGAIGATLVTLGWFFIAGRALVLAMVLDAVVFERFGSVTGFVFGLPVLRLVPRHWAWFRRYFDLDEEVIREPDAPDR
jgi:uncharacterized BrkB/YihY/UPF0761 family membrane protein